MTSTDDTAPAAPAPGSDEELAALRSANPLWLISRNHNYGGYTLIRATTTRFAATAAEAADVIALCERVAR